MTIVSDSERGYSKLTIILVLTVSSLSLGLRGTVPSIVDSGAFVHHNNSLNEGSVSDRRAT